MDDPGGLIGGRMDVKGRYRNLSMRDERRGGWSSIWMDATREEWMKSMHDTVKKQ